MTTTKTKPTCQGCGIAGANRRYRLCSECSADPETARRAAAGWQVRPPGWAVLVVAAYQLFRESGEPVQQLPDLIVRAWKLAPDLFAMPGYDLPDSARVRCCLMHRAGPVGRGLLRSLGDSRYCLTEAGTEAAKEYLSKFPTEG